MTSLLSYSSEAMLGTASWIIAAYFIYLFMRKIFVHQLNKNTKIEWYSGAVRGNMKPDFIIYELEGYLPDLIDELSELGFIVLSSYLLNASGKDESNSLQNDVKKYIMAVALTPKLILKLATIYSKHGSSEKLLQADTMQHSRLVQCSFKLLRNNKFTFLKCELLHQNIYVEDIMIAIRRNYNKKFSLLSVYFGVKNAKFFEWIEHIERILLPFGLVWFMSICDGESSWIYPIMGVIFAESLCTFSSWWKHQLMHLITPWIALRNYDSNSNIEFAARVAALSSGDKKTSARNPHSLGKKLPRSLKRVYSAIASQFFFGMIILCQLLIVVIFEKIHKRFMVAMFGNLSTVLAEVVYYSVTMFFTLAIDVSILPKILSLESHIVSTDAALSRAWKRFILRLSVFLCRFLYVLFTSDSKIDRVVKHAFILFISHWLFFHTIKSSVATNSTSFLNFDRHSIRHISAFVVTATGRRATGENRRELSTSHLQQKFELDLLNEEDMLLMKELSLPETDFDALYLDLIVLVSITMLYASFIPVCIPLTLFGIWKKRELNWIYLIQNYRRPVIDDDASVNPWISVFESATIIILSINVATLYLFLDGEDNIESKDWMNREKILRFFNFDSNLSNITLMLILLVVEHLLLFMNSCMLPYLSSVYHSHRAEAHGALEGLAEFRENSFFRLLILRGLSHTLNDKAGLKVDSQTYDDLLSKLKLVEHQNFSDVIILPSTFCALALIPYASSHLFHVPWYYTISPLLLLCSYVHNQNLRNNNNAAISILADSTCMKYLLKTFSSTYLFDNDTQRCEWVSIGLSLTWRALEAYGKKKIEDAIKPKLEASKPLFANSFELTKLTLGDVSPKILGVRVLDKKPHVDDVEVDVDFQWNSNLEMGITLTLGVGTELGLGVSNFVFAGTVRLHFYDLIPKNPPFKYFKATFFEKPVVDFSLNIGTTESMDIGYSSGNVASAVQIILKHCLETMVIYPKWMHLRLDDDADEPPESITIAPPQGLVTVEILRCNDLIIGDVNTSDPYVVITVLDKVQKTDVIYKTLNPVWHNASFNFSVHDKKVENIHFEVWDKDFGSAGDFLGKVDVGLAHLGEGVPKQMTKLLVGVDSGSITFVLTYRSLESSTKYPGENIDTMSSEFVIADLFKEDNNTNWKLLKSLDLYPPELGQHFLEDIGEAEDDDDDDDDDNDNSDSKRFVKPNMVKRHSNRSDNSASSTVGGVLAVSKISLTPVRQTNTILASPIVTYVTFHVDKQKEKTNFSDKGNQTTSFRDDFHFIVDNFEHDVLTVKVKKSNKLGVHSCIWKKHIPIHEVTEEGNNERMITLNLNDENRYLRGELAFHLQYRAKRVK
jgi:hypothetical protein